MKRLFTGTILAILIYLGTTPGVLAIETPIGLPQNLYDMEVAAVFLQPIEMNPLDIMRRRKESDIHLEADIHAIEGNPNGFDEGDWISYLPIHYELINLETEKKVSGHMMPMTANDGAHYGDNIKVPGGIGKYKLIFRIEPPPPREVLRSPYGSGDWSDGMV
jgi:hypothetical protein